MKVISQGKCDVIELQKGEVLVVASTYEMIKRNYDLTVLKNVQLRVYDNFFIVHFTDKFNKTKQHAYSDTWDFSIK